MTFLQVELKNMVAAAVAEKRGCACGRLPFPWHLLWKKFFIHSNRYVYTSGMQKFPFKRKTRTYIICIKRTVSL